MDNKTRLKNLIRFVRARTEAGALRLHHPDAYLRASAGGLRAVCVSRDAPLCHFGRGSADTVEKALKHISNAAGRKLVSPTAMAKRERSLQAHLIREALKDGDLRPTLGSDLPFERLVFALDEVPLHKKDESTPLVRCDLLAVGVNGPRLEPVLIELKWGRSLKQLRKQLEDYSDLVERYRSEFETLLGDAIGRSREVKADRLHQMIVWPSPQPLGEGDTAHGAESTRRQLEEARITAIQFDDSPSPKAPVRYRFEPEWISVDPARPRPSKEVANSHGRAQRERGRA